MAKIIVINNREGLVQGQMQPTVFNKQGAPEVGKVLTLLPGANLVDEKELEALCKNPTFLANFKNQIQPSPAPEQNPEKVGKPILEFLTVKGKDGKDEELKVEDEFPLNKLKPETAKRLIKETLVPSILAKWATEVQDPGIRHAIDKHIEYLNGSPRAPGGPAAVSH